MRKWIVFSSLLSLLLLSSGCSWKPEKEIVTKAEVYVPTINVVPRPEPLTLKNADVIVITEKNLQEVIKRVKDMQGSARLFLTKSVLDKETYQNIGSEIRKMHDAQVNHTDLNIHNILVDVKGQIWLIDFDKCFQQRGNTWKKSNLERLKRSFIKEQGRREIQWRESDWIELMRGYDDTL